MQKFSSQKLLIPDVIKLTPTLYEDQRGVFFESFNEQALFNILGKKIHFVQDNHSISHKNVLRGLHYQVKRPQNKLVRVVRGEIFDVAVDLRRESTTFGQWVSAVLSAENHHQLFIPSGFAHGFLALQDHTEVLYKTDDYYDPQNEGCLAWNDETIAIQWPFLEEPPTLSEKDRRGKSFAGL